MSRQHLSLCLCVAVAALFTAPARAASLTFLQSDTTTPGNWKGVYGQDGNGIAQHSIIVLSYSKFDSAGNVNLSDPGAMLDSRHLTDHTGGIYLIYNYSGNVTFRIINNRDGARDHPNGTVSAFYWGAAEFHSRPQNRQ